MSCIDHVLLRGLGNPKEDDRSALGKIIAVGDDKYLEIAFHYISNPPPKQIKWTFQKDENSSVDELSSSDNNINIINSKSGIVEYLSNLSKSNMVIKDFGFYTVSLMSQRDQPTDIRFQVLVKSKYKVLHSHFCSTGRRPVELMRYPFVRHLAVRLSVYPSIRKQYFVPLSTPQLYCRDLFIVTFCLSYGLVVHVQFWSSPDNLGSTGGLCPKKFLVCVSEA